ncbi:hypothetical protein C8J56DRAFT_928379 [Mycena floridula]|nr:hypothetical protein C8J56DRAFT_928379 [Mycena floridula]
METGSRRIPPLTSYVEQACFKCFKEDVKLSKCSMCKRVSYCGPDCQKGDWSSHKAFCKAFTALSQQKLGIPSDFPPTADVEALDALYTKLVQTEVGFLQVILKRPADVVERNLIALQPRCMACAKTDRMIRTEETPGKLPLQPCPHCQLAHFCCAEHLQLVSDLHHEKPCSEGHDGLTPCKIHVEIRSDLMFAEAVAEGGDFVWAPERIKTAWTPLSSEKKSINFNWTDEFLEDLVQYVKLPDHVPSAPWIRGASALLSMPMTILWALQKLKPNDRWTRQKTLTIHILGAYDKEVMHGHVFEEILHRLPEVQTVKIVMVGPEMAKLFSAKTETVLDMETCPKCNRNGRKRTHQHYFENYHELVKRMGDKLSKPDLAIAFNSGASESPEAWLPTMKYLVENKIPSLFTSYNEEEAKVESMILKEGAKAQILPGLDVQINPWGSARLLKEPTKAVGFYSLNRWIAGAF